jgi:hypothetical protein
VIPNSDGPYDPWWSELESCLSESVRIKIAAVVGRYKEDLAILRRVLVSKQQTSRKRQRNRIFQLELY